MQIAPNVKEWIRLFYVFHKSTSVIEDEIAVHEFGESLFVSRCISKFCLIFNRISISTWLILPVVICLSQRLSHAGLSTSLIKVRPRIAHYISYGSLDFRLLTWITLVNLELIHAVKL